ncbi:MAG: ABC transporter permease [Solirubrobacteraceae bacterium]|nr:ABC transporter permease [Solirubrobacteraceae bacterium]
MTVRDRLSSPSSTTWGLGVYTALLFGFLYLPLAVLALFSIVDNTVAALPLGSVTTHWYETVLANGEVWVAVRNSVFVAIGAVVIAVAIGVPGALLVDRHAFPGKHVFQKFVLLPLILPGVITGVAFQTFFQTIDMRRSLATVTLAHGTALVSTVLTTVYARLLRVDRSPEHASADLGVSPIRTFLFVTLPSIRTAILASGLLAFTLSFDEIPVTTFTIGAETTLPMYIWSALRSGNQLPGLNALATMVALAGGLLVIVFALLSREDTR